ncbi:MAG: ABC transporter permease [Gemmatimonadaceae bacterium]
MLTFYRALLRLYPASFRLEYEGELCSAFEARMRERSSPVAPIPNALATVADVVPNAVAAHLEILFLDLRFASRSLRRTPGFAITTILVIALGVGANTAAFSLADFVFLRPLPLREPDRLVKLWQSGAGFSRNELSPAKYRDWKAGQRSFAEMSGYWRRTWNLVGSSEPRQLETVNATPEFLQLLGVPALIGRHFSASDANAGAVVVLSYSIWQSQFGGDPDVLGKVVQLQGVPHTVIGVMPSSFRFPSHDTDVWTALFLSEEDFEDRDDTYLQGIARLRDGVSLEQARRDMDSVTARLDKVHPNPEKLGASVIMLRDELSSRARMLVLALCGAALCILLLACSNLASLFLARATSRVRELAVRTALGAGREQIIRQLVTESIALSLVGGAVGVAVAWAALPLLARLVPNTLPTLAQPSIDLRVLLFAGALVGITGLAFGVAPAVGRGGSGGTANLLDALRSGTRASGGRTRRLRAGLVIVEVAASVVLLVVSGLLIRSVWNIQSVNPGFRAENVLALRTALPRPKYDTVAHREQYFTRVLDDVRALPGVQRAAYITGLPMSQRGGIHGAIIPGREHPTDGSHNVSLRFVTPGFFATMGIPLRHGRDVEESDRQTSEYVAVVSESFAKRHWPNEDALGKRFKIADSARTIVGIVGDVRVRGLEQSSEPQVYLAYKQLPDEAFMSYDPKELVVRSAIPPATLLPAIRRIVKAADPEQPVANVRTMSQIVSDETASRMTQLRLLVVLSVIGLLIAGVGIHGLLSFTVSRRTQELGVRRALGAQAGGIVRLVLGEGMRLALVGVVIGVTLAYVAARGMGALLMGVRPEDPVTILLAAALCLATAIVGCLHPALRASRVDPMNALQAE